MNPNVPRTPSVSEGLTNSLELSENQFEALYKDTDNYAVLQAMRMILERARLDPLTSLKDKGYLMKHGIHKIAEMGSEALTRNQHGIAIFFIDLDGFKKVNDTYGHPAGDAVLVEVAERMQTVLRGHDYVVSRKGGDEFVAICPLERRESLDATQQNVPEEIQKTEAANSIGNRLIQEIEKPISFDDQLLEVSASIGFITMTSEEAARLSHYPIEDGQKIVDDLLRQADNAMYEAKSSGKGTVAGA